MRTTEVRALLPDAWGFICPVHTPDGSPCGLLNHLAMPVELVTHAQDASKIPQVLVNLGRQYKYTMIVRLRLSRVNPVNMGVRVRD